MKNQPAYLEASSQHEGPQPWEATRSPVFRRRLALADQLTRVTLGAVWVYQGVVPKLLFPDTGELRMLQGAGIGAGAAQGVAAAAGVAEVLFGLLFWLLQARRLRALYWTHILGLLGLGVAALCSQPALFVASFNPLTFNVALIVLAAQRLLLPEAATDVNH